MDGRYDLLMLRMGMGATQAQMAKAIVPDVGIVPALP